MTDPAPHPDVPTRAGRKARNIALLAGVETGFWDDHGRPAPWPDDVEDWTLDTHQPHTHRDPARRAARQCSARSTA
jgi:hypothetical protein